MHKGESRGLAPGIFFRPPDACHFFKKKGAGDEKGRTKTGGAQGGREGRKKGAPPLLKSCHVALIHPASLERGKGPEGLSQDRGPGSHRHAQPHTDICIHLVFLWHILTHRYNFSLPHTHTQMTLAHGAARGQFGE